MPLELRPEKNIITITIWGQEVEVYSRKPTASQVQKYNSAIIGKKGLRIKKLFKVRVAHGHQLIDGFKPGELVLNGKPLEQDTAGAWKDVVEKECPQILEALARLMLDNTSADSGADNDDDDDDDEKDEEGEGDDSGRGGTTVDDPTCP